MSKNKKCTKQVDDLLSQLRLICSKNNIDLTVILSKGNKPLLFETNHLSLETTISHQKLFRKFVNQQIELQTWMPFNNLLTSGFKVICVDGYDEYGLFSGEVYVVNSVFIAVDSLVFDVYDIETRLRITPPDGFHGFNSKRFDCFDYSKDN